MLTTSSPVTVNPFTEAAKSARRWVLQAAYAEVHLLRSVRAFIGTMPPAITGAAAHSRWAQAAPILADCAEYAAAQAADPQSDIVTARVACLQDALDAGGDTGRALRELLTVIIMFTPIGTAAEAPAFVAALDADTGLRLDLDPTDPAQIEPFSAAAAALAYAFERGDGLIARRAVTELLSFVAPAA